MIDETAFWPIFFRARISKKMSFCVRATGDVTAGDVDDMIALLIAQRNALLPDNTDEAAQ